MAAEFCRHALPAIDELLLSSLPAGADVLDLCCGSGQMARALAERGFRVTGVDASAQMLECAQLNAPGAEFVLADARLFRPPRQFAGALSTFNSLAHVESVAELEQVFCNVRASLRAGGAFLFDLSMEEAYTSKWRGTLGVVAEDHACLLRPSYDRVRRIGRNEVTVFQRCGGQQQVPRAARDDKSTGGWRRLDFCIEQKCYSDRELRQALAAAGFTEVETYDAQVDLGIAGERGRTFFVCW